MSTYLDHNATTPLHEIVLEAMLPWLTTAHGNPSSVHVYGRKARVAIDQARQQIAQTINTHPSQIIFTSGGTEANNFVIKGFVPPVAKPHIAVSAIEHASVLYPAQQLQRQGWQLDILPVNQQGQVTTNDLTFHPDTCLVSSLLANNETGVVQDVSAIADKTAELPMAALHIDASQAVGKLAVDFTASRAQFMTLSAHKFYGPQGIGALVTDKTCSLQPLLHGGGQEKGLRGGTENVANIVGFGYAAELVQKDLQQRIVHMQQLRDTLEQGLRTVAGVEIIAAQAPRLPNTVMISVAHISGETLLMTLNRQGFAVSSGSACHSEKTEPSHVLLAMGLSAEQAKNAIRISLGIHNTHDEIQAFIQALRHSIQELTALIPSDLVV